jgi:hypothetical protein
VQRLIQKRNIQARGRRHFGVATPGSRLGLPIARNVLDRKLIASARNRAPVGDYPSIPIGEARLFLTVLASTLPPLPNTTCGRTSAWTLYVQNPKARPRTFSKLSNASYCSLGL